MKAASAIKAALVYFGAALLWFWMLDQAAATLTPNPKAQLVVESLFGLMFVVLTAVAIYLIVRRELAKQFKIQAALRESEARKAGILNSALDSIITFDERGIIQEANSASERMFGVNPAQLVGREFKELIVPPDGAAQRPESGELRIGIAAALGERVELRGVKSNGDTFPIELGIGLVPDTTKRLFTATIRDITQRKRTEQALEEAQKRLAEYAKSLEVVVEERTANLKEMVSELEALSYSLSHDMRAPLRAMHSFAQIVVSEFGAKIGDEGQDYLQRIIKAAARLDQLIQDMLSYSRLIHQDFPLEQVNTDALVRTIVDERPDLQAYADQIQIQGPLLPMSGHPAALEQCIANLLENGIKFVPPGTQPRVRIRTEKIGQTVRLWIEDDGIGIPKAAQHRVTRMFERLHPEGPYPGTGIGLTIVRKAVERMRGQFGFESEAGKGSRFWIQLPALCPDSLESQNGGSQAGRS